MKAQLKFVLALLLVGVIYALEVLLLVPGSARAEGYGSAQFMGSGNTVLRSAAQSSGSTSFIAVGRTWTGSQYKALIASYLTSDGSQNLLFAATGATPGRIIVDLAGVGFDNLCNGVVAVTGGSYIAACRSMTGYGFYDTYLVKFNALGVLDAAFGTGGIVKTGLGTTTAHSFVRAITFDGTASVAVVGQNGTYSPGNFSPFIAVYNATTGALTSGPSVGAVYYGTGVDVVYSGGSYYMLGTEASGDHSFRIHKFSSTLVESGAPWGSGLSFSAAGGGADSVPSAIRVAGTRVIAVGGSRTNNLTPPWRCAIAAVTTAAGTLDTTFGQNTLSGATSGNNNKGVTLYTHDLENSYDCILNTVGVDSSNNLFVGGTAYRGANYDYLTGKLSAAGVLSLLQVQTGGSGDDITNAGLFFDGVYTSFYTVGRSHSAALYNGGAMTKVVDNSGTGTWVDVSTTNAPAGRFEHTALWTGSRLVIWGGKDSSGPINTGALFDPVSNTWTTMNSTNAPPRRQRHSSIWTGTKVIVFGGHTGGTEYNSGGMYDPGTDSWTLTTTANAPSTRTRQTGVWTGSKMIVWGGEDGVVALNTGGIYDPDGDSWTAVTTVNAPSAREVHEAVWTGSKMVVWGGDDMTNELNTGGLYDPTTNTWSATATGNAPEPRNNFGALWTGTHVLIFGGQGASSSLNTGGLYDPSANSWTAMATGNAPSIRRQFSFSWTGSKAMVWGGFKSGGGGSYLSDGASYSPATDTWGAFPLPGLSGRRQHIGSWTGSRLIIWGGNSGSGELGDGSSYEADLAFTSYTSNVWSTLATGPTARAGAEGVWTGTDFVVFGGMTGTSTYANTGSRYTVSTNTWSATTTTNAPSARTNHASVWNNNQGHMITWGGNNASSDFATGSRYDPAAAANKWYVTATGNAPAARDQHTGTWTGTYLVVWGGYNGSAAINTGSRYNGSTNLWYATNTTNAPSIRYGHSAVWNGSRVLIWGGVSSGTERADGSGYDPTANAWYKLSTTNAPAARYNHAAAWTGDKMIVWGGVDSGTRLASGGIYDDAMGTWTATSTTNAPSARDEMIGVWTGSKFVVWGGWNGTTTTATGAVLDPYTNVWTTMSTATGVPSARRGSTAVWNGSEVLIYGGRNGTTFYDTLSAYSP